MAFSENSFWNINKWVRLTRSLNIIVPTFTNALLPQIFLQMLTGLALLLLSAEIWQGRKGKGTFSACHWILKGADVLPNVLSAIYDKSKASEDAPGQSIQTNHHVGHDVDTACRQEAPMSPTGTNHAEMCHRRQASWLRGHQQMEFDVIIQLKIVKSVGRNLRASCFTQLNYIVF